MDRRGRLNGRLQYPEGHHFENIGNCDSALCQGIQKGDFSPCAWLEGLVQR